MPETPSPIHAIADDYVERYAALHPIAATSLGVPGHDAELTDYSPSGIEARATLRREATAGLEAAEPRGEPDRIARDVMLERLRLLEDMEEAGELWRDLKVLASPMQDIRGCFDLMARDGGDDWRSVALRMAAVPEALAGCRAALDEGLQRGIVAPRRQALGAAQQAAVWSGAKGGTPFFATFAEDYERRSLGDAGLLAELQEAAVAAGGAYADFERYLREDYAPRANPKDPVGRERYARFARIFNGVDLDLEATYAWGWEEVWRIQAEMEKTAEKIAPGQGVAAAIQVLEEDPARSIEGEEPFQQWMQALQDRTIAEMNGRHFDIPEPIQRIEAMIAPPGGQLAMYYTGPSEDFKRPGRTWYPTGGRTRFPLWREVSVAYHEGVPGHHLQIGTVRYLGESLSRFQRLMANTSGYTEGWALYAERLMADLGYLENPDYYMGLLSSQALRAVRVVVDIGMHLELPIPDREAFHPGEVWSPELALPFLIERSFFPRDMLASEVDRYLGWPGQAISYKVGEREWLAAREEAEQAAGAGFDLKQFHARALSMGPMGLAQLRRELSAA